MAGAEVVLLLGPDGSVRWAVGDVPAMLSTSVVSATDVASALELPAPGWFTDPAAAVPTQIRLRGAANRWLEVTAHPMDGAGWTEGADGAGRLVVLRDMSERVRRRTVREAIGRILAHELRTPITTIYGGAELLQDDAVSPPTRREAAQVVSQEAERLYRTVEDLLVLAQFEEPGPVTDEEPVLLQRFVPQIVAAEQGRIARVRLVASLAPGLPAVHGRQVWIEQILRNLLNSAAKYGPEDAEVLVTASQVDSCVEVRVTDHGMPIEAEEAATLFDLFAHTRRSTADSSGANVALFVCRRLVEMMGGHIRAEPGDSPTIAFTLPVDASED